MNRYPDWLPDDMPVGPGGTPDFGAMTDEQRERYLRLRRQHRSSGWRKNPILIAAIASFLWFIVFSPLIAAPWGPNLGPQVVDRGTADVTACSRDWRTLWRMHTCTGRITWEAHGVTTDVPLSSPRDLEPGAHPVVARNRVSSGRSSTVVDFGSRTHIVPADMPANTGASVAMLTVLNLGAIVVIWGVTIARIQRS